MQTKRYRPQCESGQPDAIAGQDVKEEEELHQEPQVAKQALHSSSPDF